MTTSDVSAEQESQPSLSIGTEALVFIDQINSLVETLPLTLVSISAMLKRLLQLNEEFLQKHTTPFTTEEGEEEFVVNSGKWMQYKRLTGRLSRATFAGGLVPRIFLVSLVSQYDAFLGRLLRAIFLAKPEVLNSSDRLISFSQLLEYESIEAAREFIIEKEVESVLRRSHGEQFDWLETKFSMTLRKGLPAWATFVELTERRNLFVHTSGIVSSQYLSVCRKHKALIEDCEVGDELTVDGEYFKAAHECILEIGVKLAHVLWRKLFPEDRSAADRNLNNVCFDLIGEGKYSLACKLLDFATDVLPSHSSEQGRRMFVVNRAQSYKWAGNDARAREILDKEDWSATSDTFRVVVASLREDWNNVLRLIRKIGATGEIGPDEYREWPVFRQLRKQADFLQLFEELFGEPLTVADNPDKALITANTISPVDFAESLLPAEPPLDSTVAAPVPAAEHPKSQTRSRSSGSPRKRSKRADPPV